MQGITFLILYQILGEAIQYSVLASVPGPLIGMLLLFLSLLLFPSLYRRIFPTTKKLMKHLMLIYIVYGAGLINDVGIIGQNALGIASVVFFGAIITIVCTALIGKGVNHAK